MANKIKIKLIILCGKYGLERLGAMGEWLCGLGLGVGVHDDDIRMGAQEDLC